MEIEYWWATIKGVSVKPMRQYLIKVNTRLETGYCVYTGETKLERFKLVENVTGRCIKIPPDNVLASYATRDGDDSNLEITAITGYGIRDDSCNLEEYYICGSCNCDYITYEAAYCPGCGKKIVKKNKRCTFQTGCMMWERCILLEGHVGEHQYSRGGMILWKKSTT